MKELKEPKTFKRPRLYFCEGPSVFDDKIRIIYTDGRSEWRNLTLLAPEGEEKWTLAPCWASSTIGVDLKTSFGKDKDAKTALKRMRAYDKTYGRSALFLGEL